MNILVVDDHPLFREGLIRVLVKSLPRVVVGEAANEYEVFDRLERKRWDLVVLDISMPGRGGLEILKQLKKERPMIPVLILTMHAEEEYAVRALRAGASGYLTKETVPKELVSAINKLVNGRKYISESLSEKLATTLMPNYSAFPHEGLSDREYQVMRMIVLGKNLVNISRELSLSVKTISTYRTRILQKMNMNSDIELMRYAMQNRLAD